MRIALDYDGTYTSCPALWEEFILLAEKLGHEVVFVTMRFKEDPELIYAPSCEVIYTARAAKGPFMAALGRIPDIWIDDMPQRIFTA